MQTAVEVPLPKQGHQLAPNQFDMSLLHLQSAPIDQQNINKLPPALLRRYDVYIHTEKRMPIPDKDLDAPAAPLAAAAGHKTTANEHPITPLRRVAAQHIGKLVRVRVSRSGFWVHCMRRPVRTSASRRPSYWFADSVVVAVAP